MNNLTPVIRPEITVSLGEEKIIVRDLPWQDSLRFIQLLAKVAKDAFTDCIKVTSDGKFTIDVETLFPKLSDIVSSSKELSELLLTQSTGKDAAWLNARGTLEAMALLDAALEVNLSEGLIELGKKVGGRLGRVFTARTNTTRASVTS